MHVSTLSLCVAAALQAGSGLASPVAASAASIPLTRRPVDPTHGTLRRLHGELDHLKTKYEVAARAFLDNLPRAPETHPGSSRDNSSSTELAKRQKEKLRLAPHVYGFVGSIQIGSPPQKLTISIDTGSSDLWIPSTTVINQRVKYDGTKSSTFQSIPGSFAIQYADGSAASGPLYKDTVALAGLSASEYTFSAVTQESGQVQDGPADGVFGFGLEGMSISGAPLFVRSLYQQGRVRSPVFSISLPLVQFAISLPSPQPLLYLGGFESSKFTGKLTYSPVIRNSFWMVQGSYYVKGAVVGSGQNFIIDSGTSIVVAPVASAAKLFANIPGSRQLGTLYEAPCDTLRATTVNFSFNGDGASKQFTIPGQGLIYGAGTTAGYCISTIQGVDIANQSWILGDIFLAFVYTTFDAGNNKVGFAPLIR